MKTRKLYWSIPLIFPFVMMFFITSCSSDSTKDLVGNWVDRYEFEGVARSHAAGFTIGEKAYIVGGYDGDERVRLQDCWEYDPDNNQWLRRDSFPGLGRTQAFAFSANGKGYIGCGYDGTTKLKDFWEYNSITNEWTQLTDFPGTARYGTVSFSINDKGYVCGGYDGSYLKDLWEFDPTTNTWTQKASLPGSKRFNAQAFVIDNIAYVFGGNSNGTYVTDFWAYDPSSDTWTSKRDIANKSDESYDDDYTSIARECGVTFVINGYGYVATGDKTSIVNTTWEYNPNTDLWTEKTALEGTARTNAVGFTIGNRGFVLTGKTSSLYLDDVWEFYPFEDYNEND